MKTIEPQTTAKIIQPFAAPCRMSIPQGGSGSTWDGIDVRSQEEGGGMAPGTPGGPAGGGGCGGDHPDDPGAAPGYAGGVAVCSPVDGYENGCAGGRSCGGEGGADGTGGGGGGACVSPPATAPIGGGGVANAGGTKSPNMPQAYSDVSMLNHAARRA